MKTMKITYSDGSTREVNLNAEDIIMQLALNPSMSEKDKKESFLKTFPGEEAYFDEKIKDPALTALKQLMQAFVPR